MEHKCISHFFYYKTSKNKILGRVFFLEDFMILLELINFKTDESTTSVITVHSFLSNMLIVFHN